MHHGSMAPTLLIVDDDPRFRALARRLLRSRFSVVADAADCAGAYEAVARLRPQAALIDIGLPDCDGLELAARLRRCSTGASYRPDLERRLRGDGRRNRLYGRARLHPKGAP